MARYEKEREPLKKDRDIERELEGQCSLIQLLPATVQTLKKKQKLWVKKEIGNKLFCSSIKTVDGLSVPDLSNQ